MEIQEGTIKMLEDAAYRCLLEHILSGQFANSWLFDNNDHASAVVESCVFIVARKASEEGVRLGSDAEKARVYAETLIEKHGGAEAAKIICGIIQDWKQREPILS